VNQIKIASGDDMPNQALSSLTDLTEGMERLGNTCIECHKSGSKTYPNNEIKRILKDLTTSLQLGSKKQQGRHLGNLAVTACATCHGTHKLAYNAKELLSSDVDMMKLIKH
jgi:mono/diheme cytochrome c family protein